ncbi:MAG: Rpn family recombination-promoting nuclease/putative transposase [Spirochaetia bacterium]|nr:Rpn family recombination-promoting nuclease/putative transposase [Spirochaetia bacterium]
MVFYHGTKKWKPSLQSADYIDAISREHVPHFKPLLFDLNRIDNKRLLGSVQTVVGLLSLKYIKYHFTESLVGFLLRELHRLPRESSFLHEFYMTLLKFKAEEELQTFLRLAREMNYRDMEEDMKSYGQKLKEEGRVKGLEEGRVEGLQDGRIEGLQDSLKRQLKKKYGLETEESVKINQIKDTAKLEAALDEILSAETKQQVLAKLGL